MIKARLSIILLCICSSSARAGSDVTLISSMDVLKWEKVAAGVWKASIGMKELASMDYAGPPRLKALSDMGQAKFPFEQNTTRGQLYASGVNVRLPLEASEKIYGLGLEFKGMNRRREVYHLKVDHYGGVKGYTHAPVPFYVSSKGYVLRRYRQS